MVNVSTLVYVLENYEGKEELFNLEELLEEEEAYERKIFEKLDELILKVDPRLVQQILKTSSTYLKR